jgi:antitoxin (DNA-binding transcriptional repressor) of toxin-antitoxin stability system
MKTATIRMLKHETAKVLSWVEEGETVEVRRRGVPVASLSPRPRVRPVRRPDFGARLRQIYGGRTLPTTGTDVVSESRGEA